MHVSECWLPGSIEHELVGHIQTTDGLDKTTGGNLKVLPTCMKQLLPQLQPHLSQDKVKELTLDHWATIVKKNSKTDEEKTLTDEYNGWKNNDKLYSRNLLQK